MFTGIVEDIGRLEKVSRHASGARLDISTALPLNQVKLGDSIAVCGACLTVVERAGDRFEADVSSETLARSVLGELRPGAPVHLERAMRLEDRLDGHLVLGHVDGTGTLREIRSRGESVELVIGAPPSVMRYVIEKGSVAVHGVSLTVNALLNDGFHVMLVPFSRRKTFLDQLKPGRRVNLEADVIGKYVARLLGGFRTPRTRRGVDLQQLIAQGFAER